MRRKASDSREQAEMLAVQALTFLADQPERLQAFVAATGVTVEGIRIAADQPHFLVGVLEHMLGDEILLVAFADDVGIDPGDVARARDALGGQWERDVP